MATQIGLNSSGTGVRFQLGTTDNLVVPVSVAIVSSNDAGIAASGTFQLIDIFGFVSGVYGVSLANASAAVGTNYQLFIGQSGIVQGQNNAISANGSGQSILNFGQIIAHGDGINLDSTNSFSTGKIYNYGSIVGQRGIYLSNGSDLKIYNYGKIVATDFAIISDIGKDLLFNRGQIEGSVDLFTGDDRLLNRGLITGTVNLGSGADFLDNRGGTIEGKITLGQSDDTLLPGASIEDADGGTGKNTLDFTKSSGVRLALDGSIDATGWAADDTYTGFDNLLGSNKGNDTLIGNANDNLLKGGGGNDVLNGLAGADLIYGGNGADTLAGGTGNDFLFGDLGADKFAFTELDLAGTSISAFDIVEDFNAAEKDRIDLSAVDANTTLVKDQAFTFIGSAAFHNKAGELRIEAQSGGVRVFGDTNGDGTADFMISVTNLTLSLAGLVAADFVL